MKRIISILVFLSAIFSDESYAQVKCYRFSLVLQGTDWRDTSCVACTSDPDVIADVNNQLSKQFADRNKHINGAIAAGNASVNKNAHYNFLWHFKVNEWSLREMSMEVCDGRPYSDIDLDTAYWFNTIGFFCPWTSIVAEELTTVNIPDMKGDIGNLALYPNPAVRHFNIVSTRGFRGTMQIYNINGMLQYKEPVNIEKGGTASFDISQLPAGLYMLQLNNEYSAWNQRLSIAR